MDCHVIYSITIVITWHVLNTTENGLDNDPKVFGAFLKSVTDDADHFPGRDVALRQSVGRFLAIGHFVGEQLGRIPSLHIVHVV